MRTHSLCILAAASLALACKNQPASAAPARAPAAMAPADEIRGQVTEKIDVNQYSYLKIKSSSGEVWTAVPRTNKGLGEVVSVLGPVWMENFKSATLARTWPRIAFGTLQGEPPLGHPAMTAPTGVGPVKVSKAEGPQGRTIADVWAQRAQLVNRRVAVRGKVVKATDGAMGKNWLHLRDGTGQGPTSDLAVASAETAGVGDVVIVTGTVRLDRDLGAGYHYDVIIEDAQVRVE